MTTRFPTRQLFQVCLALLVSFAFLGANADAQNNALRWSLKEGQKLKVEITETVTQTMNAPGGEMEIPIERLVTMHWEVTGVEDDKFMITQVIKRMKIAMEAPMMEMSYDSEDGEAEGNGEQLADQIDPLIDAETTFVMDSKGKITEVKLDEDVAEELKSGGGGGMGAGSMVNEEMVKQLVLQGSLVLPEDVASAGTEWDDTTEIVTPMMSMNIASKYKYVGEEEVGGSSVHKIDINSEVELTESETPFGGSIEIDEQESTGEAWFDNNKGFMTKAKSTQKMVMLLDMMGQEMDMESEAVVEVKISPVTD